MTSIGDRRGEEDEGGALGDQEPPQRRLLADVGDAGADALADQARIGLGLRQRPRSEQDPGDRVEGDGVEQQRGLDAEAGDDQPGHGRADGGAAGEGDVEHRVAGAQFAGRLEQGGDDGPGQRPPGQRQRSVDRRQHDHPGEGEVLAGEQRQGAEGRRLAAVDDRQGEARRRLLDPRDQDRREQGGEEAGADEERRGRQGASGAVEDEHREGHDPHPVAHLVDRVARRQAPKLRPLQGVGQA